MKYFKIVLPALISTLIFFQCSESKTKTLSSTDAPEWAKDAVWYQIFVERFRNGDSSNDPTKESLWGSFPQEEIPSWEITPWTQQWYKKDPWFKELSDTGIFLGMQARRYGGDLQGVLDKLDYMAGLGINAIYFNPLNDSPSLHKYDAAHYRHIDRHFGPFPQLDTKIMERETPEDPSTWEWTSADSLFLKVIAESHKRGIRVVMDYSWNHTGMNFWAFQDVKEKGKDSKFVDWYEIEHFDNPETAENEFAYTGWAGVKELPEFKRFVEGELPKYSIGFFEGNYISESLKQHIFSVTRRWLDPNNDGDPSDGIDGYRLDVAAEVPMGFWREYRNVVKAVNPEAIIIGEIWWEEWPERLLDPKPWLGEGFDAVMNYRWYRAARSFFAQTEEGMLPSEFVVQLKKLNEGLEETNIKAMMNMTASHDSPRLSTSLYNKGRYKSGTKGSSDKYYKTEKPDAETYEIQKLLLLHQYTYEGAPQIWAGDESGMWGADDPSCRKPLVWSDLQYEPEDIHPDLGKLTHSDKVEVNNDLVKFISELIQLRKSRSELTNGAVKFIQVDDENMLLAYSRMLNDNETVCVFNLSENEQVVSIPVETNKAYKNFYHPDMMFSGNEGQIKIQVPARSGMILLSK